MKLSSRVQKIKPSPTLAVTQKAAELKAMGKDIIGLGAGEPDFDTPPYIKDAAIEAINQGYTKYTAVDGTPQLKNAIIQKLKNDNNLSYKPEQILVSAGAKQSLYNLMQALLDEGDEVIIPAPYWVSYPDMALLADAKPIIIKTTIKENFKISPEKLEKAITPNTKLFILNSPSNPTGMAYTKNELVEIGKVLENHPNIMICIDDIYEHILWTKESFCNLLMACPKLYDRTILVNGVSKAFSMTGWRIGYACGPADLIKAMKKIQGQSTSNPTSISQYAATAALEGELDDVREMTAAFKERHDFVVNELNNIKDVTCLKGDGTFYAFPDVSKVIAKMKNINNDSELAEYLLENAGVAVVPGSAFGAPGYIRISFATSMSILKEALSRLKNALEF